MFNDSFNSIYLGNATLAQPPNLSIVTKFFRNSFPPSLNSASTPCPSATDLLPPAYLTAKYGTGIKPVGSSSMRMASSRRREKLPKYSCPFPGCSADFVSRHNRECLYFSTHYMISPQLRWKHPDHMNAHLYLRPYKCAYSAFGCIYKALAPRTVTHHNQTCKYNPKND